MPRWAAKVVGSSLELLSQMNTLPSWLPIARLEPFEEMATAETTLNSLDSVVSAAPVATSHTLTVLSLLAEASTWPSRDKATEKTPAACPLKTLTPSSAFADGRRKEQARGTRKTRIVATCRCGDRLMRNSLQALSNDRGRPSADAGRGV